MHRNYDLKILNAWSPDRHKAKLSFAAPDCRPAAPHSSLLRMHLPGDFQYPIERNPTYVCFNLLWWYALSQQMYRQRDKWSDISHKMIHKMPYRGSSTARKRLKKPNSEQSNINRQWNSKQSHHAALLRQS